MKNPTTQLSNVKAMRLAARVPLVGLVTVLMAHTASAQPSGGQR